MLLIGGSGSEQLSHAGGGKVSRNIQWSSAGIFGSGNLESEGMSFVEKTKLPHHETEGP